MLSQRNEKRIKKSCNISMFLSQQLQGCCINQSRSYFGNFFRCANLLQRFSNSITHKLNKPELITCTNSSHQFFSVHKVNRKVQNSAISFSSDYSIADDANGTEKTNDSEKGCEKVQEKNFWGAVGLIIGTAVGPGMLGLPAATIKSGPLPSIIAIVLSWVYVISSIILVAELSFAAMNEDGVAEVSFTGLARKTLGNSFGSFVALVYASLSFTLLVACVSGIGSIVSQWFPRIHPIVANALFPSIVGIVLYFFPFETIDAFNRFLCILMLFSIAALVAIGLSVGRTNILSSFTYASWSLTSVLPAIPVTVLTLGFHVITPFICKIAGHTVNEARKAILLGGFIPLVMVLSWNLIVLGLASTNTALSGKDPISLLLSVNSSALPAVQSFAFSALATSLIGYAVSFPKQVVDTLELISGKSNSKEENCHKSQTASLNDENGKVGFVTFTGGRDLGKAGNLHFKEPKYQPASKVLLDSILSSLGSVVTPLILGIPVLIASFFPSTFSRALDFAGVYANCFLFGILPPAMTHIYQSRKKKRLTILPGGGAALLLLFVIAVILAIWH